MPFDEEERDPHGECRNEIERLRAALAPFAKHSMIDDLEGESDDEEIMFAERFLTSDGIRLGDLRRARAVYNN